MSALLLELNCFKDKGEDLMAAALVLHLYFTCLIRFLILCMFNNGSVIYPMIYGFSSAITLQKNESTEPVHNICKYSFNLKALAEKKVSHLGFLLGLQTDQLSHIMSGSQRRKSKTSTIFLELDLGIFYAVQCCSKYGLTLQQTSSL